MQRRKVLGIGAASATMLVEDTTTPDKQLRVLKRINVSGWEQEESGTASDILGMIHDWQKQQQEQKNNERGSSGGDPSTTPSPLIIVHSVTAQNAFVNVVTEYLPLGTLTQLFAKQETPFSSDTVLTIFEDVLQAVADLHQMGIVHCRVTTDRVFIRAQGGVGTRTLSTSLGLPACSLRNFYLAFEVSKWKGSEYPPEVASAVSSIGGGGEVATAPSSTFRQGAACAANPTWDLWFLGTLLEKLLNHKRSPTSSLTSDGSGAGDRGTLTSSSSSVAARSKLHSLALSLIKTDPQERPSLNACWGVLQELRVSSPRKEVVSPFPHSNMNTSNDSNSYRDGGDNGSQQQRRSEQPRLQSPLSPVHAGIVGSPSHSSHPFSSSPHKVHPSSSSSPIPIAHHHHESSIHAATNSSGIVQMPGRISIPLGTNNSEAPTVAAQESLSSTPSTTVSRGRDSRPVMGGESPLRKSRSSSQSPLRQNNLDTTPPRFLAPPPPLRRRFSPLRDQQQATLDDGAVESSPVQAAPTSTPTTTTTSAGGAGVWKDKLMAQFEELEQFHRQQSTSSAGGGGGSSPSTPLRSASGIPTGTEVATGRAAQRRAAAQRSRSMVDARGGVAMEHMNSNCGSGAAQDPLEFGSGRETAGTAGGSSPRLDHKSPHVGGRAPQQGGGGGGGSALSSPLVGGRTPSRGGANARSKTSGGGGPPDAPGPRPVTQNELRLMKNKHERFRALEENHQYREQKLEEFARRREEKVEEKKVDQQQHRERQRLHKQQMRNIQQKKESSGAVNSGGGRGGSGGGVAAAGATTSTGTAHSTSLRREIHKFGKARKKDSNENEVADTVSGVHIFVKDPPSSKRRFMPSGLNASATAEEDQLYPEVLVSKNFHQQKKAVAAAAASRATSSPAKPRYPTDPPQPREDRRTTTRLSQRNTDNGVYHSDPQGEIDSHNGDGYPHNSHLLSSPLQPGHQHPHHAQQEELGSPRSDWSLESPVGHDLFAQTYSVDDNTQQQPPLSRNGLTPHRYHQQQQQSAMDNRGSPTTVDKAEARRAALAQTMGGGRGVTSPLSLERPNHQVPMPTAALTSIISSTTATIPSRPQSSESGHHNDNQNPREGLRQPNFEDDGEVVKPPHHHADPQASAVQNPVPLPPQPTPTPHPSTVPALALSSLPSGSGGTANCKATNPRTPGPAASASASASARHRRGTAQDLSVVAVMEWQIDSLVGGLHRLLEATVVEEVLSLAGILAKDTTVSRTLPACNAEFAQRVTNVILVSMEDPSSPGRGEGEGLAQSVLPIVFQIVALQSVEVLVSELGDRAGKTIDAAGGRRGGY